MTTSERDPAARRTMDALTGCRIGDALGESLFGPSDAVAPRIGARELPDTPPGGHRWTDDTLQTASVATLLCDHGGELPPDVLARHLATHVTLGRGYGFGSRELLLAVRAGADWRTESRAAIQGRGSFGNGAAMRVAPVGAWHAGNPDRAVGLARTQALVTHAHPEAADGAAAVAAVAAVLSAPGPAADPVTLLRAAAHHAGPGRVRDGLHRAQHLLGSSVDDAAAALGTGRDAAAYDTVPFALWSAVQTPADFVATFWRTVSGLGDRDTTCAIACAIVAAHAGADAVPRSWMQIVEPLPGWAQGDVCASRRL